MPADPLPMMATFFLAIIAVSGRGVCYNNRNMGEKKVGKGVEKGICYYKFDLDCEACANAESEEG